MKIFSIYLFFCLNIQAMHNNNQHIFYTISALVDKRELAYQALVCALREEHVTMQDVKKQNSALESTESFYRLKQYQHIDACFIKAQEELMLSRKPFEDMLDQE